MEEERKRRCFWCNLDNPLYVAYHDHEWGVPEHDDQRLFEMLILESFQAGLSWECVLNKREAFRLAFNGFHAEEVAEYDDSKVEEIASNPGVIRHRGKIRAAIHNARIFLHIQSEFGSFDAYLQRFTKGRVLVDAESVTTPLSDALSADLRRRGMKFVGSTIVHSFLQAIGAVWSHEKDCFLHDRKA